MTAAVNTNLQTLTASPSLTKRLRWTHSNKGGSTEAGTRVAVVKPAPPDGPDIVLRIFAPRIQAPLLIEASVLLCNSLKKEIYEAWVGFNWLPAFMRGVYGEDPEEESHQASWILKTDDGDVPWEARTIERVYADHITWESTDAALYRNHGQVNFARAGCNSTRVDVCVEFEPHHSRPAMERTVQQLGSRLCGTLEIFRTFAGLGALPSPVSSL